MKKLFAYGFTVTGIGQSYMLPESPSCQLGCFFLFFCQAFPKPPSQDAAKLGSCLEIQSGFYRSMQQQ